MAVTKKFPLIRIIWYNISVVFPEDIAVCFSTHACHPARVGEEADLPEVGPVRQGGGHLPVLHDDVHYPLLDEVHLRPDRPLFDYDVT